MNKAVLLSIKPQYCELIASGKKTVEVRKTKPKIETPFKCYIYCTVGKSPKDMLTFAEYENGEYMGDYLANGKVIGEFICDGIISHCEMANADIAEQQGCIKREELLEYAGNKNLYGWHISDLVIYDKPKELSEFKPICRWMNDDFSCMYRKVGCSKVKFDMNPDNTVNFATCTKRLSKAPQSWCYVEELEAEQCSGMTF